MSGRNIMDSVSHFDESGIYNEIENESLKIEPEDIDKIISKEKRILRKTKISKASKYSKLFFQVKLVFELIKDYRSKLYTDIPWRTIGILTLLIAYFINPFDIIPDVLPVLGYTDDALLFAAFFKSISVDLKKYSDWKGYDTEKYF